TIVVENIKKPEGELVVAIFDCEENYLKKEVALHKIKVKGDLKQHLTLKLRKGVYAVAIFQDTNNNGELDKNFIGLPKEGFGFSNKSLGTFGPPSFEETKFSLAEGGAQVKVELKYF
ncbi:DUF2141 domain-containing protein, partial [Fulvivirga sp. RKSG066]|uniref:DUF2141 domain-containing protein n=1 Tax=Fulvivirga aurantia TaxID=2529383 RepID=UPI0012BC2122